MPNPPSDSVPAPTSSSRPWAAALAAAFVVGIVAGAFIDLERPDSTSAAALEPPTVRQYDLTVQAADLQVAPNATWHAWTYNGQVPGPLITANVGDTLKVTVRNDHDLTHSFHTHLAPYELEYDGSQINTLTGIGAGAMIAPGASYTYVFHPSQPGVYYYHCHSAAGDKMISQHIAQGLYGAIVIEAPDEAPVRDEAVFMAERGFDIDGSGAPTYVMNGKGIPGGEHALEQIYAEEGLDGVVAQFGKTVPMFSAKVGETLRLSIVNIGDQIHSFHLHGINMVSVDLLPGRIHPANVVQLVPGGADRILITPTNPGVWLFHCHVVLHADMGMIGVLVVEEA